MFGLSIRLVHQACPSGLSIRLVLLELFVLGCCSPVQISGVGGRMVELAGVSSAGWVATRL